MAYFSVISIVNMVFEVFKWLVVIRCLLSFVRHNPYQPVIRFIYEVTEPVMAPFRRLIPAAGGIDFSPIIVFFAIQLVQVLVVDLLRNLF